MKMKTAKTPPTQNNARLSDSLNQVLADSYALLSLTHLAHWNVEGPGFFALHTAFQTQYEELFIAIDEIAERIRALGAYAIGGLSKFAETARMQESASPPPKRTTLGGSSLPTRSWWPTRPDSPTWRARPTIRRTRT